MCGIAGYISKRYLPENTINQMIDKLKHRGPDSSGIWKNSQMNIFLGHTRLSILDLSSAGSQPMVSGSGRFVISFNGEIYNHIRLRKLLEKDCQQLIFNGTSDTETILHIIERFGIEKGIPMLDGMFAICILDLKIKKVYLARDRFGEKPLYYQRTQDSFIFGSDIQALKQNPLFIDSLSINSINYYFKKGYVPSSKSIFENTSKVMPGHLYEFDCKTFSSSKKVFWSSDLEVRKNHNQFDGTIDQAVDKLDCLLSNSIQDKLISDVPIGIFLSGGIDSSIITSLACKKFGKEISTFSIGINDHAWDESKFAREISNQLGSRHHEFILGKEDIINHIPKISQIYSEPVSDTSQIPTYLVSKFAREKVTVALSGDGGDELFGGYSRYINGKKIISFLDFLPFKFRKSLKAFSFKTNIDRLDKAVSVLDYQNNLDLYNKLTQFWNTSPIHQSLISKNSQFLTNRDDSLCFEETSMLEDTISFLPESVLTKVDRATMAVSLESRAPFLDPKIFKFAWSLPISFKIHGNANKLILRLLLSRYLETKYFERPKMGFGLPIGEWINTSLYEWSHDIINSANKKLSSILDINLIRSTLDEHNNGTGSHANKLWSALMFIDWHNNFFND